MAHIAPFRAVRYSAQDQSRLVAPPYDILDQADKEALLARSDRNVVAVDLPHTPPKEAGPKEAYERSARTLLSWLNDGTLKQDSEPALYVYHQIFRHGGRHYTRQMFFARLRLEEFGKGQVFPHEQTFGGPKADRLMLTRATRANVSPIFGLYPDANNDVASCFGNVVAREPDAFATMDKVENRLWLCPRGVVTDRVISLMKRLPVFIADGHHRYGTALNYRNELMEKQGGLPDEHPANYVLCVFAGMEDPGLLILPTHRVLCGLSNVTAAMLTEALSDRFDVKPSPDVAHGERLVKSLSSHGPLAIAAYCSADDAAITLSPRDPDLLAAYEPKRGTAWRQFSLSILHRYILDEVVTQRFAGGAALTIHYIKDDAGAIREAKQERGVAILPQATTMAELRAICTAGELMPQKSTYFFPKLATGLVINPLVD